MFVLVRFFCFQLVSDFYHSKQESFSEAPARFVSPCSRSSVDISQQLYLPGRILQVEERESVDSG